MKQRRKHKLPRGYKGKTRKHHWFKSAAVLLRMMIDGLRSERARKRVQEAKREPMYSSVQECFKKERTR